MFVFSDLSRNGLTGEIPSAIGGLASLENLSVQYFAKFIILMFVFRNLSENELTGEIPRAFGRLASLKFLSVPYRTNWLF